MAELWQCGLARMMDMGSAQDLFVFVVYSSLQPLLPSFSPPYPLSSSCIFILPSSSGPLLSHHHMNFTSSIFASAHPLFLTPSFLQCSLFLILYLPPSRLLIPCVFELLFSDLAALVVPTLLLAVNMIILNKPNLPMLSTRSHAFGTITKQTVQKPPLPTHLPILTPVVDFMDF